MIKKLASDLLWPIIFFGGGVLVGGSLAIPKLPEAPYDELHNRVLRECVACHVREGVIK